MVPFFWAHPVYLTAHVTYNSNYQFPTLVIIPCSLSRLKHCNTDRQFNAHKQIYAGTTSTFDYQKYTELIVMKKKIRSSNTTQIWMTNESLVTDALYWTISQKNALEKCMANFISITNCMQHLQMIFMNKLLADVQ